MKIAATSALSPGNRRTNAGSVSGNKASAGQKISNPWPREKSCTQAPSRSGWSNAPSISSYPVPNGDPKRDQFETASIASAATGGATRQPTTDAADRDARQAANRMNH